MASDFTPPTIDGAARNVEQRDLEMSAGKRKAEEANREQAQQLKARGGLGASGLPQDTRPGNPKIKLEAETARRGYEQMARRPDAEERLSRALTGQSFKDLDADQQALVRRLISDINGGSLGDVTVHAANDGNGVDLPEGVQGAFVKGAGGGTIYVDATLRGEELTKTLDEELGEAIAEQARALGIDVKDGDAGARVRMALDGSAKDLDLGHSLFRDHASDSGLIEVNGELVEAEFLQDSGNGTNEVSDAVITTLDFEDLSAGDTPENNNKGVTITGQRYGDGPWVRDNFAMIFDTANPTGGDANLGYATQGKALIISEDNNGWEPDDNETGGQMRFDFDEPAEVLSLRLLDIEEQGGTVLLFDDTFTIIGTIDIPATGANGHVDLPIYTTDVSTMIVQLKGGGAMDDLRFVQGSDVPLVEVSTLDFEGLANGEGVAGKYADVTITAQRSGDDDLGGDDAMILDTGGSPGNALIISADGDSDNPSSFEGGGEVRFDFAKPSDVLGLKLIDVPKEGGEVRLYDADDNLLAQYDIPATDDYRGGMVLPIHYGGVSKMIVALEGKGAIDGVRYVPRDVVPVDEVPDVVPPEVTVLDFDHLDAGVDPWQHYAGVTITAQKKNDTGAENPNDAMIYDTENPTGGDTDLAYDGQGKALIISKDNNKENPDDNASGGHISFDFENPTQVLSLRLLDIEEKGGTITLYGENSGVIGTINIPATGANGLVDMAIHKAGVSRMTVDLQGGGAIDDLHIVKGGEDLQFKPRTLDFAGSATGDLAESQFDDMTIRAQKHGDDWTSINDAMIFGTGTEYEDLEEVLIISSHPDHTFPEQLQDLPNRSGGDIRFDFDVPTDVLSLTVADISRNYVGISEEEEEDAFFGGAVYLYDAENNLLGTVDIPITAPSVTSSDDDRVQEVQINYAGVSTMIVELKGQGGIDNLQYVPRGEETQEEQVAPEEEQVAPDEEKPVSNIVTMDFEDRDVGEIMVGQYINGVRYWAGENWARPEIFDTEKPTGGHTDLRHYDRGNVLMSEKPADKPSTGRPRPGEAKEKPGTSLNIEFEVPSDVLSLRLLDADKNFSGRAGYGTITLYGANSAVLGKITIPYTGDKGQLDLPINYTGVKRMEIEQYDTFAIDDLRFVPGSEATPEAQRRVRREEPIPNVKTLDFETFKLDDKEVLKKGELVGQQYEGVSIYGRHETWYVFNKKNYATIFDTANPSSGQEDLYSEERGNALIVAQHRNTDNPKSRVGGWLQLKFDEPTDVIDMRLLDVDEKGGFIRMRDAYGIEIGTIMIPTYADKSDIDFAVNFSGVSTMEILLEGDGAIDDVRYVTSKTDYIYY